MTTGPAPTPAPPVARPSRPRRRSPWRRLSRMLYWLAILGLVGLNAWWLGLDLFPPPELGRIQRMIERKEFEEARVALRAHLRRSPNHGEARSILARLLAREGDRAGAVEQLHRVPAWWPSKREALFIEGQLERELDRARQAEAAWWDCLRDDPLHPTPPQYFTGAAKGLLEIYAAQGRMEEARLAIWEDYKQDAPGEHPALMTRWLNTLLLRVERKEAIAVLRGFVAADVRDWQSRRALARLEEAEGRPAEADRLIREALAIEPRDPRIRRDWLAILTGRNDRGGRARALGDLPPEADAEPEIWSFRGFDRLDSGDLRGAADAFRRASEWRPFDEELAYRLSGVERRLGQVERANALLRRSKGLRAAREQLPAAADEFSIAARAGDRADLADASRRLADLCHALGWVRASEAFAGIAARPY